MQFFSYPNFGDFYLSELRETKKPLQKERLSKKSCCRGRDRTFTGQLAVVQSSVVDPGRTNITVGTALYYVYSVFPTLETRGHVCQAFAISSPHSIIKNLMTQI